MLSYEEAVRFHGHNGPFLAIGYRMGQFANESLSPQGISDISCVVKSPLERPFTCLVDGIQCATDCTLGKENIELKPAKSGVSVLFRSGARRELTLRVRSETIEYALNCSDLERCAHQLLEKPITEIVAFHEQ